MTTEPRDTAAPPVPHWRDWLAVHMRIGAPERAEVYASVAASASLKDATYWAEIVFSAGIATLGLTLGSPAVIIGAMLISPLMGPIMGAGLALAAGDLFLAVRSTLNIVVSSVLAIGLSTALVVLLPFREMTEEIASRTQPNTLDLIIALFSGAVGALAVCKSVRGIATSIPGVAIAVALMPPLGVTGYGVGVLLTLDRVQGISIVRGGGLLFMTNLVAITFSSMLVFLALHIDDEDVSANVRQWRKKNPDTAGLQNQLDRLLPDPLERIGSLPARLLLVAALVAVVFIPLKRSFDNMATEIRERQELNTIQKKATAAWETLFGRTAAGDARSFIDRFDAVERDGKLRLTVRVFISESVSPAERNTYLRQLARELGHDPGRIDLSIIEIPTSQYQVARAKQEPTLTAEPEPIGKRLSSLAAEATSAIARTRLPPSAVVLNSALTLRENPEIQLQYLSPTPISADAAALVAADVQSRLGLPTADVRLQWVPARTVVAFDGETPEIEYESRQRLRGLSEVLRRHPDLEAIIRLQGDAAARQTREAAVAEALVTPGAPPPNIRVEQVDDGATTSDAVVIITPRQ